MCIGIENCIDMPCLMSIYRVKSVQIWLFEFKNGFVYSVGKTGGKANNSENLQTPIVKVFKGLSWTLLQEMYL